MIGPLRSSVLGCEPSSGKRLAKLRSQGVRGYVVFNQAHGRAIGILVRGGKAKTSHHVGIDTPTHQALKAYPHAKYDQQGFDPSTGSPTPGMIWINNRSHPMMAFEIPSEGGTAVSEIDVPSPSICE
jgi:hypothetical protein